MKLYSSSRFLALTGLSIHPSTDRGGTRGPRRHKKAVQGAPCHNHWCGTYITSKIAFWGWKMSKCCKINIGLHDPVSIYLRGGCEWNINLYVTILCVNAQQGAGILNNRTAEPLKVKADSGECICQHFNTHFYQTTWNIARGTTDPGYWVYN